MKKRILAVASVPFLLFSLPSNANEEYPLLRGKVTAAIERFEQTDRSQWSYKVTRYENEEGEVTSSIETHQPHSDRSQRWSLLQQNGKEPTAKQVATFQKNKLKQYEESEEQSFRFRLSDLIEEDTLVLKEQDEHTATLNFGVSIDRLGDDAQSKLTGELTYNKQAAYIEQIKITNLEPFKPMFMVTISSFDLTFVFQNVEGAILPLENRMDMMGKMSFFTDIEETSVDTYSDFVFQPGAEIQKGESAQP